MRNKFFILIIGMLLFLSSKGQVPNTATFSLSDVTTTIFGDASAGRNLSSCFTSANSAYFDPAYSGSKNSLLNFRNYHCQRPAGLTAYDWNYRYNGVDVTSGNVCYYKSNPILPLNGRPGYFSGVNGTAAYWGEEINCDLRIPDGYYVLAKYNPDVYVAGYVSGGNWYEISCTTLPTVTTVSASNIGNEAYMNCSVQLNSWGNGTAGEWGFQYCATSDFSTATVDHYVLSNSTTPQTLNQSIWTYPSNTVYFRAYATSGNGTVYGSVLSANSLPDVSGAGSSNVAATTATVSGYVSGYVTTYGNLTISAAGFVWGTSANPTLANSYSVDASGSPAFNLSHNITGLNPATIYNVRAYATNSSGTSYSSEGSFTTTSSVTVPTVTTTSSSSITNTSFSTGGNVTSDGGSTVTQRGVVYGTNSSPTLANSSYTTDGTGTGSFTSYLTELTGNTNYYYRAYATNSVGTSYGGQSTALTYPTVNWSFVSGGTGDYISISINGTEVVNTTATTLGSFQVSWGDAIVVTVEGGAMDFNACHLTVNGTTYDNIQSTPGQSTLSATSDHNIIITASTYN